MLELSHINVYYGDLQAVQDVCMAIGDAEIVTLIGSNGAGKSTTLATIAGLVKPQSGQVTYDGTRLDKLPPHKIVELGISMVPEGRGLFPEMSVLENLELGAFNRRARQMRRETVGWIYEIFPVLKERAKQAAGTLSGGEQQMLAIGRALMSRPRLLMLDEMSLGLAPVLVEELCRILININESRQITVLLVEQNVNMALRVANRGYIIENGQIVGQGMASFLLENEQVKQAYLGLELPSERERK